MIAFGIRFGDPGAKDRAEPSDVLCLTLVGRKRESQTLHLHICFAIMTQKQSNVEVFELVRINCLHWPIAKFGNWPATITG